MPLGICMPFIVTSFSQNRLFLRVQENKIVFHMTPKTVFEAIGKFWTHQKLCHNQISAFSRDESYSSDTCLTSCKKTAALHVLYSFCCLQEHKSLFCHCIQKRFAGTTSSTLHPVKHELTQVVEFHLTHETYTR